jgi:hypothetical protein
MNWKVLWKEMVVEYGSSQAFAWIDLGKTVIAQPGSPYSRLKIKSMTSQLQTRSGNHMNLYSKCTVVRVVS